jgi:hypothetical protein
MLSYAISRLEQLTTRARSDSFNHLRTKLAFGGGCRRVSIAAQTATQPRATGRHGRHGRLGEKHRGHTGRG